VSMIIGMLALATLMLTSGLYAAFCAASGLGSGRLRSPFWDLERARNPLGYWLVLVGYGMIALVLLIPLADFLV